MQDCTENGNVYVQNVVNNIYKFYDKRYLHVNKTHCYFHRIVFTKSKFPNLYIKLLSD